MKTQPGGFYVYGSLLNAGYEGWELVAALPQTETIKPGGDDPPNVRTAKILLIYKRPMRK
jgi:hypothetical protein